MQFFNRTPNFLRFRKRGAKILPGSPLVSEKKTENTKIGSIHIFNELEYSSYEQKFKTGQNENLAKNINKTKVCCCLQPLKFQYSLSW